MLAGLACISLALFNAVGAQQIWDVWETANDQSVLFERQFGDVPINFVSPGPTGDADIVVDDGSVFQDIDGFGAALTDSSAQILNDLKNQDSDAYWNLLGTLFNPADGAATAALSVIRVPLGASDFSPFLYSYCDQQDPSLSSFSLDAAPFYLWSTLADIQSAAQGQLKIFVAPWSAPAWMTEDGTMLGSTFDSQFTDIFAQYLFLSVQGFANKGFNVYAIAIQNEPENSNPTVPTMLLDPDTESAIASQLRSLLDNGGFGSTKIVSYEHNWDQAAFYPVTAVNDAPQAFAGASFHCYEGSVTDQMSFFDAEPGKELYFTECTGTIGSDWWEDIKWDTENLAIGALTYYARSVILWNIALDGNGNPKLPGGDSCQDGCRAVVTVNSDGSYQFNQEYYVLAHGSRAIVPKDSGGPFGQRIGVSVGGPLATKLQVGAYKTGRAASAGTDWNRYSLVVMNCSVQTTIEFRGQQATYNFPVGLTTLWWFAEN
ncbi:glycoside hydrolase family 30 protein [Dacryopinax primogenitus]|uniref:Glycoside hydrolase family 30 protein n=1 Tax=Dacryopinax primogenitus (strain DJM 731) TaxID=1858805 RepID=M5FYJ4_DACPD|nr:glycoside hydrolase family 30 protein [Dacryopinax primogenitus]EJT98616.1 glycoside hydrolase family 30 protein [Dacryopinax primogenitus]